MQKNATDDLGSNGTKTPDTVNDAETGVKEVKTEVTENNLLTNEVCGYIFKTIVLNSINNVKRTDIAEENEISNMNSFHTNQSIPLLTNPWNIESYNFLLRNRYKDSRSRNFPNQMISPPTIMSSQEEKREVTPNHLFKLYTKYEHLLSVDAKNYLKIDFCLDNCLYQDPSKCTDSNIRDLITTGTVRPLKPDWKLNKTQENC